MEVLINSIGFGLIIPLLLFLLNSIFKIQKDFEALNQGIDNKLKDATNSLEAFIEKERLEGIMAHQRLDVVDTTLSDVADEKFNSELVVKGSQPYPSMRRLRRSMERSNQ